MALKNHARRSLLAAAVGAMHASGAAAAPFVEPDVTIIHELHGEAPGDQFGWIAQAIGDVNGDGVADFATCAPTKEIDGANAGRIYMYCGRTGELLWKRNGMVGSLLGIQLTPAGDVNADGAPDVFAGAVGISTAFVFSGRDGSIVFRRSSNDGGMYARGGAGVGDVNGDGHADVLVGAPQFQDGRGRVYLYSGKDGALLRMIDGEEPGDQFGAAVDGHTDARVCLLIIGAPGAGPGDRGQVYVFDGRTGDRRFIIESDETGAQLGRMFVSAVGDVDADGVIDVYASDWADGAKGPQTGRVYVHSGATGERLRVWSGEAEGEGFGIGTAEAGDIDGDGQDDLIIGAWKHASGAPSAGRCTIFSGKTGEALRTITCNVENDTFGFDATHLGDVDGDGVQDFLVTAAWSAVNGAQSGRVFVLSGAAR